MSYTAEDCSDNAAPAWIFSPSLLRSSAAAKGRVIELASLSWLHFSTAPRRSGSCPSGRSTTTRLPPWPLSPSRRPPWLWTSSTSPRARRPSARQWPSPRRRSAPGRPRPPRGRSWRAP
ncbi:hypothetical protein VPH35_050614 [Triticum aestivum]